MKKQTDKKYWLFLHQIQGYIAMWAVRQSPYYSPDGLLSVLQQFETLARNSFNEQRMALMNRAEVNILLQHLDNIPEFLKWNERKNGREGLGFCSRYDHPHPDDDFIDLDALKRNVVMDLFKELELDDKSNRKIDWMLSRWNPVYWFNRFRCRLTPPVPATPESI